LQQAQAINGTASARYGDDDPQIPYHPQVLVLFSEQVSLLAPLLRCLQTVYNSVCWMPSLPQRAITGWRGSEPNDNTEGPGQKLKRARERLNLRYRDVEEASQHIANVRGSDEYALGLSRIADIENKGTVPTIFRLYALCAIYRLDPLEVLQWYGVDVSNLAADATLTPLERTHSVDFGRSLGHGSAVFPLALDPGVDVTQTTYLSRLIQRWGTLPLMLLNRLDFKHQRYAFIGTEDWSMHPILPPGSLVMVDEKKRKVEPSGWITEFERPIYFLEHRDGYVCSWCSLESGRLTTLPHPSSTQTPSVYVHPDEIEVVGQVIGVAMRLDVMKNQ
jgi:transcriptional regulator with XRE-family HTH domain